MTRGEKNVVFRFGKKILNIENYKGTWKVLQSFTCRITLFSPFLLYFPFSSFLFLFLPLLQSFSHSVDFSLIMASDYEDVSATEQKLTTLLLQLFVLLKCDLLSFCVHLIVCLRKQQRSERWRWNSQPSPTEIAHRSLKSRSRSCTCNCVCWSEFVQLVTNRDHY